MPRKAVSFEEASSLGKRVVLDNDGKPVAKTVPASSIKGQIKRQDDAPVLKFRYLCNRFITLREVNTPPIPSRAINVNTNQGSAMIYDFDLSPIHEVRLRDENPKEVHKTATMSPTFYAKAVDQAEQTAINNRLYNDMIRYDLASYVENGTLEIVEDPFEGREVSNSDYENAVNTHRQKADIK